MAPRKPTIKSYTPRTSSTPKSKIIASIKKDAVSSGKKVDNQKKRSSIGASSEKTKSTKHEADAVTEAPSVKESFTRNMRTVSNPAKNGITPKRPSHPTSKSKQTKTAFGGLTVRLTAIKFESTAEMSLVELDTEKENSCEETLFEDVSNDSSDESMPYLELPIGSSFLNKWTILEKINHAVESYKVSTRGNSYRVVDKEGTQGILRCMSGFRDASIMAELSFLDKMDRYNCIHLFNCVLEVNTTLDNPPIIYIVTSYRPGHRLSSYLPINYYMSTAITSVYTSARFLMDMLGIVETVCKAGCVLRNLTLDHFSYDEKSRRLYMSERSDISVSFERQSLLPLSMPLAWTGDLDHAPLTWHCYKGNPMTECDCIEVLFYLYLDMLGLMSWKGATERTMISAKRRLAACEFDGFEKIPAQLVTFWLELRRGRMVDVNRIPALAHGTLMTANAKWFREGGKPAYEGQKRAVYKGEPMPTTSMLDYKILHGCLVSLCRVENRHDLWEWDHAFEFDRTEFADTELPTVTLLSKQRTIEEEFDLLTSQVAALEMDLHFSGAHQKQMAKEMASNEIIIEKYVKGDSSGKLSKSRALKIEHDVVDVSP